MRILDLPLMAVWFLMIESGEKERRISGNKTVLD